MKLVDNWKSSWKWLSVHVMALGAVVQTAWVAVPDGLKMRLTDRDVHLVAGFLFFAGIIGRLVDQNKPS